MSLLTSQDDSYKAQRDELFALLKAGDPFPSFSPRIRNLLWRPSIIKSFRKAKNRLHHIRSLPTAAVRELIAADILQNTFVRGLLADQADVEILLQDLNGGTISGVTMRLLLLVMGAGFDSKVYGKSLPFTSNPISR